MSVFLLADRSLPVPPDAAIYPGLELHPVEAEYQQQTLAGIQRIAPAAFAYSVSPAGYCGCYFGYETVEELETDMAERDAHPDNPSNGTPESSKAMWRSRMAAVNSFGGFLAAHSEARLAVYAVWEHCAGQREPVRADVPPSYFSGPGFEQLPEDVLLTIVPEAADGENPRWDPAAPRTHEWLGH